MSELLATLPSVRPAKLGAWLLFDLMRASASRSGWNRAKADYIKVNSLLRVERSGKLELYRQHSAGFSRVPESAHAAVLAPLAAAAFPAAVQPTGEPANAETQARGRRKGEGRRAKGRRASAQVQP